MKRSTDSIDNKELYFFVSCNCICFRLNCVLYHNRRKIIVLCSNIYYFLSLGWDDGHTQQILPYIADFSIIFSVDLHACLCNLFVTWAICYIHNYDKKDCIFILFCVFISLWIFNSCLGFLFEDFKHYLQLERCAVSDVQPQAEGARDACISDRTGAILRVFFKVHLKAILKNILWRQENQS